jgi:hypothetical protein
VRYLPNKLGSIGVVFVVAALVVVVSDALAADGPWNQKPRSDWDRADVHRILLDSPWVRRFRRTNRALESEVPDPGPSGMELRGYHAKESKDDGTQTAEFYVRWVSSRTLRAALARGLDLRKQGPRIRRRRIRPSCSTNSKLLSPVPTCRPLTVRASGSSDRSATGGLAQNAGLRRREWNLHARPQAGFGGCFSIFPGRQRTANRSFPSTTPRCGSSNRR